MKNSSTTRWAAAAAVALASLVAIPAPPATADPAGDDVVINELYTNGTGAGAKYKTRYFELYNPGDTGVNVRDWTLQYKSAAGASFSGKLTLPDKTIPSHGHLLVAGSANSTAAGEDVPNVDVSGTLAPSGSAGVVALSRSTATLTTSLSDPQLVDLVGYGSTATLYEGAPAATGGNVTSSISRNADHLDTDHNNTDFSLLTTPTPCGLAGCQAVPPVEPPADPVAATIGQIQGSGQTSPLDKKLVTTKGVVTAVYKTGGYNGAFIQTPGTGGTVQESSQGLFVFGSSFAAAVDKGDYVQVTGEVTEFGGTTAAPATLTELTPSAGGVTVLDESFAPVVPAEVDFPLTAAAKERLEGMLVLPQGDFTITNNYTTHQYGEIGLAPGDKPFDTPTNVVAPGAAAAALQAENDEALVTLDDGASVNYLSAANQATPAPWLTPANEVRAGQAVTFDDPVVLDYRNSLWKLQPTEQLLAGDDEPVEFGPSTRAASPRDVGGDVTIGTFNVLNYFTTTAADYVAGGGACTTYNDRAGNPVTANECGTPTKSAGNGPRGAADAANLARQEAKIVSAINTLDADVVSLEEIENSAKFGKNRDAALETLVAALNAKAGSTKWAAVPSPATLPDLAGQDLIRTAFIYQPAVVEPVGSSRILDVAAFDSAREPLAQAFKPAGGSASGTFAVIVNHFKSKGSGSGADADQGDGQGASNASRVAQAEALVGFADEFGTAAGTDKVFLTGDFNAYNEEDPVKVIEEAGFVNVPAELTDKETYQFDGQVGSLDHVFASAGAFPKVTGADIWNINSYESLAREYSRFNANVVDFYDDGPYRASDHDPEIVGFDVDPGSSTVKATAPATVRSGGTVIVRATVASDGRTPTGAVTVSEGSTTVGTGDLVDGTAEIAVEDLAVGTHVLTVAYAGDADHTGGSTTVKVEVLKALADLEASAEPSTYGTSGTLDVTGSPGAGGLAYAVLDDELVGMGTLKDGRATIALSATIPVGDNELTVLYGGSATHDPGTTTTSLTVGKAGSTLRKTSVSPSKVVKNRTKPFVTLSVKAAGFTVDGGKVTLRQGGKSYSGTVRDGSVRIRLGVFTSSGSAKKVTASYAGNDLAKPSTTSFTVMGRAASWGQARRRLRRRPVTSATTKAVTTSNPLTAPAETPRTT